MAGTTPWTARETFAPLYTKGPVRKDTTSFGLTTTTAPLGRRSAVCGKGSSPTGSIPQFHEWAIR